MKWNLVVTPGVEAVLRSLPPQTKSHVREALDAIRKNPMSGKPLRDELAGLYSFRTRRFRVIYQIRRKLITVIVVAIGHRRAVYEELAGELRSKKRGP